MPSRIGARGFLALFFFGAAVFFGWLAVSLLVGVVIGHGSAGGNVLSMGLGLMLLILFAFLLVVGIINWRKSSQPSSEDAIK
jgi:cytosine/uracil/thiamine/allantoin permease